jgi:uncharacterized membrane protein YkvA (DUF1232 family)
VGTALYLVSPVDLLPELFLPLVGALDDGLLITLLVTELSALTMDYFKDRKGVDVADSTVDSQSDKTIDVEVS